MIVIGGGPAGENIAGRCVDCGASDRGGRGRAARRRVLVLGVHAEQGAAAAGRGARRGAAGAGRGRGGHRRARRRRGARLARRHHRALGRRRPGASGSRARAVCSCAGTAGWSASGASTSSCPTAAACAGSRRRKAVVLATGSSAVVPPIDGLRDVRTVGQPRHHQREGGARAAARARRRRRRCRDGPGVEAARCPRGDGRRPGAAPRPAVRAVRGRAAAAPRSRTRASPSCSTWRSSAAERDGRRRPGHAHARRRPHAHRRRAARRHRSAAQHRRPRARRASGWNRASRSRSTTSCAPPASTADGSTPSATSTAARCSRTWASTRRASPPTPSSRRRRSRRGPTTGRCPSVVFTDPQLASVGLTEATAREQGIDVKVVSYGTGDVAGASVHGKGIDGHVPARGRRRTAG